jgi:hypothetical protein
VPGNPFAVAVIMTFNPVLLFPVGLNPFSVFVVVAFDPNPFTWRVGAYLNGSEGGEKGQADTKKKQFHFQILIPF